MRRPGTFSFHNGIIRYFREKLKFSINVKQNRCCVDFFFHPTARDEKEEGETMRDERTHEASS